MFLLGFTLLFILWTRSPLFGILSLIAVFINTSFILLTLKINFLALIYLVIYVGAVCVLFLFVLMLLNLRSYAAHEELKYKLLPFGLAYMTYIVIYCVNVYNSIDIQLINRNVYNVIFNLTETLLISNYLLQHKFIFIVLTLLLFIAIVSPVLLSNDKVKNGKTIDMYSVFVRKQNTIILTKQSSFLGLGLITLNDPSVILLGLFFCFLIYLCLKNYNHVSQPILWASGPLFHIGSLPINPSAIIVSCVGFCVSVYVCFKVRKYMENPIMLPTQATVQKPQVSNNFFSNDYYERDFIVFVSEKMNTATEKFNDDYLAFLNYKRSILSNIVNTPWHEGQNLKHLAKFQEETMEYFLQRKAVIIEMTNNSKISYANKQKYIKNLLEENDVIFTQLNDVVLRAQERVPTLNFWKPFASAYAKGDSLNVLSQKFAQESANIVEIINITSTQRYMNQFVMNNISPISDWILPIMFCSNL